MVPTPGGKTVKVSDIRGFCIRGRKVLRTVTSVDRTGKIPEGLSQGGLDPTLTTGG